MERACADHSPLQNYLLTTAFISRIESLAPTLAQLESLRCHSSYTTFVKRFQLPVYFQLRFKEIVTGVERAFDLGSASGGGDIFVMSESEAVWKALKTCWAEEVYLEELAGRFWRLTLQVSPSLFFSFLHLSDLLRSPSC